jgi:hypothetical protein
MDFWRWMPGFDEVCSFMPRLLVTGSSGLIGSEVVDYFGKLGLEFHGWITTISRR